MKSFGSSIILSTLALALTAGLACKSEEPAAEEDPCGECTTPATLDLMTPAVSFATNVLPIFSKGCGTGTCHGVNPYDPNAYSTDPVTAAKQKELYPANGLYLSCSPDPSDPMDTCVYPPDAATITKMVAFMTGTDTTLNPTGKSKTDPAHKVVEPGNPDQSFMVAKLYGCQSTFSGGVCTKAKNTTVECDIDACGDYMPPPGDPDITDDERDTIRRWIAQGALNN